MERSNTQSIRQVLEKILRETPLQRKLLERRLIDSWEEVMGASVARATSRLHIRDGVLHVSLKSSVLRNELFMMRTDIVRRLNEEAGEQVINDIDFR